MLMFPLVMGLCNFYQSTFKFKYMTYLAKRRW